MTQSIPRIVNENPKYDLAVITMMIFSIPYDLSRLDALAVFPGMGEEWRINEAVKIWNQHENIKTLLIAGVNNAEDTYEKITIESLKGLSIPIQREEGVIFQDEAYQTNQQTDWIVKQMKKKNIASLGLVISPYHLLRAYCTLIQSIDNSFMENAAVFPIAVPVNPNMIIPETGVDAWRMAVGEYERMEKYQQKGDVAAYDEVKQYIAALWENAITHK